jgi:hypothetical protein
VQIEAETEVISTKSRNNGSSQMLEEARKDPFVEPVEGELIQRGGLSCRAY